MHQHKSDSAKDAEGRKKDEGKQDSDDQKKASGSK